MRVLVVALLALTAGLGASPQPPPDAVRYVVTFPEPEHHWVQIEATFSRLGRQPLRARMSRSSPGRYAVHEFAKNVFSFEAFSGADRPLAVVRHDADQWDVSGHDGTVRIVYRLFGDHADGTYVGVDTTHAHLNAPATFIWGVGFDDRAVRVTFVPPPDSGWKVGTQLFGTADPWTFTAPNLPYFMDSPVELSDFKQATFTVANGAATSRFRVVVHSTASQQDVEQLSNLVQRLVSEEAAVYGEFPVFEPGEYTFLLDYAPWVYEDGMEHRNSTYVTFPNISIETDGGRHEALEALSHEFFHVWNLERVRPSGLEPFDFTRENVTCCLWLGEGFTQYYGPLLLARAGLASEAPIAEVLSLINRPGRAVRSAVQASEYAPFADAAVALDTTDQNRTFTSYYTVGAALALALDFSLREQSAGRLSLDDYMRRLWQNYGKPAGARPGHVRRPYSLSDLRRELAELTGMPAFASTFFDRYVEGLEVPDFARLLSLAGYAVRPAASNLSTPGYASLVDDPGGLRVGDAAHGVNPPLVPFGTPLYDAGVDTGDVILRIDDGPATRAAWNALSQRAPGTTVSLGIRRRDGKTATTSMTLVADPAVLIEPIEISGRLTPAQRAFREAWMGSKTR